MKKIIHTIIPGSSVQRLRAYFENLYHSIDSYINGDICMCCCCACCC